ncbi:MAG: spore coat protein [Clostridia bacterium]
MATINVNVKDSLMDVLMQEKDILKVYASFLPEAACPELRTILQKNMDTIAKQQFTVFETMNSKGFYEVKPAQVPAIDQAKQKFATN